MQNTNVRSQDRFQLAPLLHAAQECSLVAAHSNELVLLSSLWVVRKCFCHSTPLLHISNGKLVSSCKQCCVSMPCHVVICIRFLGLLLLFSREIKSCIKVEEEEDFRPYWWSSLHALLAATERDRTISTLLSSAEFIGRRVKEKARGLLFQISILPVTFTADEFLCS